MRSAPPTPLPAPDRLYVPKGDKRMRTRVSSEAQLKSKHRGGRVEGLGEARERAKTWKAWRGVAPGGAYRTRSPTMIRSRDLNRARVALPTRGYTLSVELRRRSRAGTLEVLPTRTGG